MRDHDVSLLIDGKPSSLLLANVEMGPDVWEGLDYSTGTIRRSKTHFDGATLTQQSFDFAHVEFKANEKPKSISLMVNGKIYDRVLSLSIEPELTSDDMRAIAKIAVSSS